MKWRATTGRTPIGIDVGERLIKAAQLARSAGEWHLEAAAAIPRSESSSVPTNAEVRRLCDLLGQRGFKGNSIVLSIPGDKLLTGILELPPRSSKAPIDQIARSELARMHKCDGPEFEMACWDLPAPARAANSTFVMAVGCKYEDAVSLLDLFEGEGFDVQCLGTYAAAVARACEPLLTDVFGDGAILDIGWTASRLILLHAGVMVYERKLHHGGLMTLARSLGAQLSLSQDEAENLLWALGLSGEDAAHDSPREVRDQVRDATMTHFQDVVKEMRIPFSYLANQYPDAGVQRVFLVGGGAGVRGLKTYLASTTELQVWPVLPTDLANCPESSDHEYGSSLTGAIGLARSTER